MRALNYGKRAIIIGIDNRATEISNDTGLLVLNRDDVATRLDEIINTNLNYSINLPWENISKWKSQFHDSAK